MDSSSELTVSHSQTSTEKQSTEITLNDARNLLRSFNKIDINTITSPENFDKFKGLTAAALVVIKHIFPEADYRWDASTNTFNLERDIDESDSVSKPLAIDTVGKTNIKDISEPSITSISSEADNFTNLDMSGIFKEEIEVRYETPRFDLASNQLISPLPPSSSREKQDIYLQTIAPLGISMDFFTTTERENDYEDEPDFSFGFTISDDPKSGVAGLEGMFQRLRYRGKTVQTAEYNAIGAGILPKVQSENPVNFKRLAQGIKTVAASLAKWPTPLEDPTLRAKTTLSDPTIIDMI